MDNTTTDSTSDTDWIKKLQELQDEWNKNHPAPVPYYPAPSPCPSCGRCPTCGKGGYGTGTWPGTNPWITWTLT